MSAIQMKRRLSLQRLRSTMSAFTGVTNVGSRALLFALLMSSIGCHDSLGTPKESALVVSVEQTPSWVRRFNPLSPLAPARWPARGGVYESMMVYNSAKKLWVPWLATSYAWSDDALALSFELRNDVAWSDGNPFRPEDVLFTFELLKKFPTSHLGGILKQYCDLELLQKFPNMGCWRHALAISWP